ncbi:MAG: hypothetical protein ACI8R9_001175 [Paraglaciecola sp.]|jgi:hypothetical protein
MKLLPHPEMQISKHYIGSEQAPLLVVDNFIAQTEQLINHATKIEFLKNSPFYPGSRAVVPIDYRQCLLTNLQDTLVDFFALPSANLRFSVCHYSMVTTPADQLKLLQRIPHFDSLDKNGLAAVHYLFKTDMGGTSFYRHRKTGFETLDETRKIEYFRSLESEIDGPDLPQATAGYINGDTALYERIAEQAGIFNRLILYRRNSLHSGSIANDLRLSDNPLLGRLTISSFIDCLKPN